MGVRSWEWELRVGRGSCASDCSDQIVCTHSQIAMDHIRNIQEIVDEHRESLPTGVVVDVMRECQSANNALPKLWKVCPNCQKFGRILQCLNKFSGQTFQSLSELCNV